MSENEQLLFGFCPLSKEETNELIKENITAIPQRERIADARVMLQQIIRPQDLMYIRKSVDDAKTVLEMYKLQAKDLLISKGEKKRITDLVENTIGDLKFWAFKAKIKYYNWKEEIAMVDQNTIIKKKMIAELIRLVEEGMDVKTITPKKITGIYTQLCQSQSRTSPVQVIQVG